MGRLFYTNLSVVSLLDLSYMTIKIYGKVVDLGSEQINNIYMLSNANMGEFLEKGSKPRSWLAERLFLGKEVSWKKPR